MSKSSKRIGVVEKGEPQMEARPAGGSDLSCCEMVQPAGSELPCLQALPAMLQPSAVLRTCSRNIVQESDSQLYGALARTSSPLESSSSFLPGATCSLYPATPFKPTPKVG